MAAWLVLWPFILVAEAVAIITGVIAAALLLLAWALETVWRGGRRG